MLNYLKFISIVAVMLCFSAVAARAQSITLHEGDLRELLEHNAVSTDSLWIINGKKRLYSPDEQQMVSMGKLSGLLWNLAAMRLIDQEAFSPDEPVVLMIDDFEFASPFREIITMRHLLAGTAGFATPPWYFSKLDYVSPRKIMKIDNDWRKHIIPVSNPGIVGRDDPVGQALLAKAVISYWGMGYTESLQALVFASLGIDPTSVQVPTSTETPYDSFFAPTLDIRVSADAFAKILTVLSNNQLESGEKFLSALNYTALMKGLGWRVHPLGPGRSYGFALNAIEGRRIASLMPSTDITQHIVSSASGLIAFPDVGIVIAITDAGSDGAAVKTRINHVASVIAKEFLPRTNYFRERKEMETMSEVRPREGYFMLDNAATSWLGEKLYRAKYYSPYIVVKRDSVHVNLNGEQTVYNRLEPRLYQSAGGEKLYVSDGSGGYIAIGEELYRYTGAMGNPYMLISPFLLSLITLFTASIHWFSKRGQDWQRFARWSVSGAILFAAGFIMEVHYYPIFWIEEQFGFVVLLWRAVFNIGLMLILTAPMYAWRFGRQNVFHKNVKQMVLGGHVIVIAAAALVLTLLSVGWGLAGELMP